MVARWLRPKKPFGLLSFFFLKTEAARLKAEAETASRVSSQRSVSYSQLAATGRQENTSSGGERLENY